MSQTMLRQPKGVLSVCLTHTMLNQLQVLSNYTG